MKKPYSKLPPVLYQDDDLLVLDKPSGLLTVPDRWDKSIANLSDLVRAELGPSSTVVHRLDRDTSGVIVVARNIEALRALQSGFDTRRISKTYIAITGGVPVAAKGFIDVPLGYDPHQPGRMKVDRRGKDALTRYEVTEVFGARYALIRLTPETGRQHQLRVHLRHIGCPVVGDRFYGDASGLLLSDLKRGYKHKEGDERPLIGRLALHAQTIRFAHPKTGQELAIEAPLPRDFEVALKYLRKFT